MKIKRYLARSMPEALKLVREDLGQEAVIIFSRKVRGKGLLGFLAPPLIEVTAALDEAVAETSDNGPVHDAAERAVPAVNAGSRSSFGPSHATSDGKADEQVALPFATSEPLWRELSDLKLMVSRLLNRRDPAGGDESLLQQWERFLRNADIDALVTEQVLKRLSQVNPESCAMPGTCRDTIIQGLQDVLCPAYEEDKLKRMLVFVGPTGVGKTTTLAKLAAQLALIEQRRVVMVTIDTYRLGAVEQLRTYAEIMDLPLEVALTPGDLAQALARHSEADYVLIDTAGRPSKNTEQVKELLAFLEVINRPFDVLLVLSSNTKMRDLSRIAGDFQALGYSKIIFTKVDETETLGCIVNIVREVGRPVVYVTNGQNVPYDIHPVDPQTLAGMVVERMGSHE